MFNYNTYKHTSIAQCFHSLIYMRAPRINNKKKRISKYLPCWTAIHRIVLREIKTGLLFRDHRKYKILRKSILFISRHTECVTGDYETRWVMAYQLQHIIFRKEYTVCEHCPTTNQRGHQNIISKQTHMSQVYESCQKHIPNNKKTHWN